MGTQPKISTQSAAGTDYGYARVSTAQQHEDRQVIALLEQGIKECNIFVDKQSGKNFDREKYQKLLRKIRPGDCLFLKSLDRFGRNYDELMENWRVITREKQADIVVLDFPLLDTRIKNQDLTGRFICDLILQIMGYLAEMERLMNHQRQAEGIAVAKAKGVKFGRPALERPKTFHFVYETWRRGEISGRAAARELGIAPITFKEWASEQVCNTP